MPSPDQIGGLHAWWKADAITGLTDNAAVSQVPDSSGNSRTGDQVSGGNQPTYQTNEINGLPVLRFDGSNDYLSSGASGSLTAVTQFAVVRITDNTNETIRATNGLGLQWRVNAGVQQLAKQATAVAGNGTTTVATNTSTVLTAAYVDGGSGTYAFWVNGANDGSGSHAQTITTGTFSEIGGANGFDFLAGDIAELIVYASVLSATDRAQVHQYLSDKYGIPVADYPSQLRIPVQIQQYP